MAYKACEGEPTIECGNFQQCAHCGTLVRHDLVNDRFWGWAARGCRESGRSSDARFKPSEKGKAIGSAKEGLDVR
jgi:hypothetical protein